MDHLRHPAVMPPPYPEVYAPISTNDEDEASEAHALLASHNHDSSQSTMFTDKESEAGLSYAQKPLYREDAMSRRAKWVTAGISTATFGAGILACLAIQAIVIPGGPFRRTSSTANPLSAGVQYDVAANAAASSTFHFPPASPTNGQYATYFPTNVGYAGPTPTGNEAGLIETGPAYPVHTGAPNLVGPSSLGGAKQDKSSKFDIFKNWGNLT